jgi:hypothetical protein
MHADKSKLAQRLFSSKAAHHELHDSVPPAAVMFNDMVQLAHGKIKSNATNLMAGINQSILLRKQYIELLQQLSFEHSKAQAAASTTDKLAGRNSDKFSLKFKRDSVTPAQVFALLTINHPTDNHIVNNVVLHVVLAQRCERIEFPPLNSGRTQQLFEESDPVLQKLLNCDAEIIIMP